MSNCCWLDRELISENTNVLKGACVDGLLVNKKYCKIGNGYCVPCYLINKSCCCCDVDSLVCKLLECLKNHCD